MRLRINFRPLGKAKRLILLAMATVIAISGFLAFPHTTKAAIARVQAPTPTSIASGTSIGLAWTSATTGGNLLLAALGSNTWPTGPAVTPPSGWTLATSVCAGASASVRPCVYLYYIENASSHSGTETFTLGADNDTSLALFEYSGIAISGALDKTATNFSGTGSGTIDSGTTATTTQADELWFAVLNSRPNADAGPPFDADQSSPTNSFTQIGTDETESRNNTEGVRTGVYERTVSATGTANTSATLVASSYWAGLVVTFKAYTNSAPGAPTLSSPANGASVVSTTPTLQMSATDPDSNDIEYNVQVDTVNTFDSQYAASIAFVQSKSAGGTGTTPSVSPTSTPTSENLLVASISSSAGTAPTMSGWTPLTPAAQTGPASVDYAMRMFYKISDGTESTITGTVATSDWVIAVAEYSGVGTLDIENSQLTASGTTHASPSVTPTSSSYRLMVFISSINSGTGNSWSSETIGGSSATEREDLIGGTTTSLQLSDRIVTSTSGSYAGSSTSSNTATGAGAIAIFTLSSAPLLNKLSVTPDATFTDVTNGADTHPFASGDQIEYTVQAGDALTRGNTYYWRVRGKDPSGSNTYGAWSGTRSFTVNSTPAVPTLINPSSSQTAISTLPQFQLRTTDTDSDYLKYHLKVYSAQTECNSDSATNLIRSLDQTSSQTGWQQQNTQSATAYTSSSSLSVSSLAYHQYQPAPLTPNTAYWWKGRAIDPGGVNTWTSWATCISFTTATSEVQIQGGTEIRGGTTVQ